MRLLARNAPALAAGLVAATMLAGPAMAAIGIDSATVDGGASTTVLPGATIEVAVTVSGNSNTNWQCTIYTIEGQASANAGTPSHNENQITGAVETFDITAPTDPGAYDLTLDIYSNGGCNNDKNSLTLTDAIVVAEPMPPLFKRLVSGPLESSGLVDPEGCGADHYDGTDAACTGFAAGFWTGPEDAGPIGLNLDFSQHFAVEIVLTNNGEDGDADGVVVTDTFGADFDLDPLAHADWRSGGFPLDGECDYDDYGPCGAEATAINYGYTGIEVVEGDCSVVASQPPNDNAPKQPEFIDIRVNDLLAGEACTILVFVQTVENPGGGNDYFEPTGCRMLGFTTGDGETGAPIHDTFTLNEGLKAFDGATGDRLTGPVGSLQLTCNAPVEPI